MQRVAGTGIDRRTVLRSGAGIVAGSLAVQGAGTVPAAAEEHENWPIQRFDRGNTGYNPDGTALRDSPETVTSQDVRAGHTADYLVVDGTFYLHGADGTLGAIDAGAGSLEWTFDEAESALVPEFVEGDVLVARSLGGDIFAIDRNDGSQVAARPTEQGYGLAPGTSGRWFAPLSGGEVVAGERDTRELAWTTPVEGTGVRPAVADGRVFVSTVELPPEEIDFEDPAGVDAGGRLYALDADDGSVLWERSRVGGGLAPPAVRDGTVYWTGTDGDILTYDAETGESGWAFKTDRSFNTPVALADGLAFAGNDDGALYAVDTESGDRVGRVPLGGPVNAGPVVVGDVVYAGTTTGSVFAFDYDDVNVLWDFAADTPIRALSVWGGRAVVGTDGGYHVLAGSDSASGGGATTADASDTGGDTGGSDTGGSDTDGGDTGSDGGGGDTDGRQRGLFSNGGDEPAFISNGMNLTVLGFLLSVAGIVHQMLQGR